MNLAYLDNMSKERQLALKLVLIARLNTSSLGPIHSWLLSFTFRATTKICLKKELKETSPVNIFLLVQLDFVRRRQLLKKLELQVTGRNVRAKDGELAASQAKVDK